jgi:tetratricopeptide (TPR) repeat protein
MRTCPAKVLAVTLVACLAGLPAPSQASAAPGDSQTTAGGTALRSHADWLQQAQALEQNENWEGLLDWGMMWADSNPRSALAQYVQGRALGAMKRYPEAIGAYLGVLQIDPNNVNALNNLGNAYRNIGRFMDALLSYREALRIDPDFVRAWHNLGVTYYGLKGQAGLTEALKEAEGINPEIAAAWQDLLLKYMRNKDDANAMSAMHSLVRQHPHDLEHIFNILLSRVDP